jgi:hypothetical protein
MKIFLARLENMTLGEEQKKLSSTYALLSRIGKIL